MPKFVNPEIYELWICHKRFTFYSRLKIYYWRIFASYVGHPGLSVCLSVCGHFWDSLTQWVLNISTSFHHARLLLSQITGFTKNIRSRSKVKVTGVKSLIFEFNSITQKVFVRFSQNLNPISSKLWDRPLLQDDLEKSKVKLAAGVKVTPFFKNL